MTVAMPRPQVDCTPRLTSSGAAMPGIACPSSKAMARSICGSPKMVAKTNASAAPTTPTSIPRTRRLRAVMATTRLVAGEAEQVPAVVGELVHPLAGHERGGALLGTDEIDRHHGQQQAGDGPGQQLPEPGPCPDGDRSDWRHHRKLPGLTRP